MYHIVNVLKRQEILVAVPLPFLFFCWGIILGGCEFKILSQIALTEHPTNSITQRASLMSRIPRRFTESGVCSFPFIASIAPCALWLIFSYGIAASADTFRPLVKVNAYLYLDILNLRAIAISRQSSCPPTRDLTLCLHPCFRLPWPLPFHPCFD